MNILINDLFAFLVAIIIEKLKCKLHSHASIFKLEGVENLSFVEVINFIRNSFGLIIVGSKDYDQFVLLP